MGILYEVHNYKLKFSPTSAEQLLALTINVCDIFNYRSSHVKSALHDYNYCFNYLNASKYFEMQLVIFDRNLRGFEIQNTIINNLIKFLWKT